MLDKQKYFEELYEVESKDIPTHSFLARDFGVKKECKYFVETGTHLGHGVCLLYTSPSPRDRG